jgi:hypothetical protein
MKCNALEAHGDVCFTWVGIYPHPNYTMGLYEVNDEMSLSSG